MHSILYKSHVFLGWHNRPAYAYSVFHAAKQAVALGYKAISVVEFGVAGGNGLLAMEKHAENVSRLLGIDIEVYGFDTGSGLPQLEGYRDIMHQWHKGAFPMDFEKLQARLKRAKLVIGEVGETVGDFYEKHAPAPIGAVMFDVDLYSSTKAAMRIFDGNSERYLPRVRCYFDDILGNEIALTNEYTGEQLAISQYNSLNEMRKITAVHHLRAKNHTKKWYFKCYVHHAFDHPRYCDFVGRQNQSMPLQ